MYKNTLKDLDIKERPRERFNLIGQENLLDIELLAIILGSGGKGVTAIDLARQMLNKFGNFYSLLSADIEQLIKFKNVGYVKAITIKAVNEICIRVNIKEVHENQSIKNPKDIFEYTKKEFYKLKKEKLYLLCLNSRNKIISKDLISIGGISETTFDPREIFRQALLKFATSIVIVHNHPSGDTNPSTDDILLTGKIAEVGSWLGISLVDHIIVSDESFTSMKALSLFVTNKLEEKGGD